MNKKTVTLLAVMICFLGIVVVSGKIKTTAFNLKTGSMEEIDSLAAEQLVVKVLPVKGDAVYLAFPDGGNMLIDTGNKSDSGKLAGLLKDEITTGEKKYGLMGVLGWKPRIDWVVLTSPDEDRTGGLEKILSRFKVRKVITYADMDIKKLVKDSSADIRLRRIADIILTLNIDQVSLGADEEIDLEQVVSQVKMLALNSKGSLSLRLTYSSFSFVYLSDPDKASQSAIVSKYGSALKSTIMCYGKEVSDELSRGAGPRFSVKNGEDVTFITDGKFLSTVPFEYLKK